MKKYVYGNAKRSDLSQKILSNVIGSVMVWGGISNWGTSEIVVVNGALKDSKVLQGNKVVVFVVAFFLRQGNARILQQNNAIPHTARHTQITLNRTILTFWIGLQDRHICQLLSTFGTFFVVVKDINLTSTKQRNWPLPCSSS